MKTQSTAFNNLKTVFTDEQAMMLADLMVRALEEHQKTMASTKDIEIIKLETEKAITEAQVAMARSQTELAKSQNRTLIWLVGLMASTAGLIIAGLKLL